LTNLPKKNNNNMVLTPLRKRLFGADLSSQFNRVNSLGSEPEGPLFKTINYGNHVKIEADLSYYRVESVDIEWNYSYIYIKGIKVYPDQMRKKFSEKIEMPKGARKKEIEALISRKTNEFYVKVPLTKQQVSGSDSLVWVDSM
jgi:HSP20 family molecular chaperone IbpA